MDNIWFVSALWMALALLAATGSLFITITAALFEIFVGAIAGNTLGLPLTPWINYTAFCWRATALVGPGRKRRLAASHCPRYQ
jgi:hypothetical protein